MTIPRRLPALASAVFAVALVALPAIAGSETTPTIEAENKPGSGLYSEEHHAWAPSQVTVGEGGEVTLKNPGATVPHGVEWVGGPQTPTCAGVPVGTSATASGTSWSGTCTFAKAGTYTFYCTVHGREMSATITVTGPGTPGATPTPTPTTPTTTTPTTPTELPAGGLVPLVGSSLRFSQHGGSVKGSLAISAAGAGGRLEIDLFARGSSLAKVEHAARVRVGRLVRGSVFPGSVSFAVKLDAAARRALARHRRLALTVKITLTPVTGRPSSVTRTVVERV